jgi:predicted O-methyltransferase YrrM
MKFQVVNKYLDGIPYTAERNAETLYNFIIENRIKNVLELGFAHGKASCFIAAALDELGEGQVVCVDLLEASFTPSIEDLLQKTGLGEYVKVVREQTGYNWFLHNEIKASSENHQCASKYDLCIIDGPKNWTIDGLAFFLADKLLNKNGWMIFDDYAWAYSGADKQGKGVTDGISHRSLSDEELKTPQIKEVFQLLVMQHPSYSNFTIHGEGDWAWAQKTSSDGKMKVNIEYNVRYKDLVSRAFRMANGLFRFRNI